MVHVPDGEAKSKEALELQEAFAHYFSYRADSLQSELKELFRVGRRSLGVGMTLLAACLRWVANWRPIEIFIYDWWPIVRRRNLYRRLAAATVDVRAYPTKQAPATVWRSQA